MEVRKFLPEQPNGTMSMDNLRNNFLALFQGDLRFLRPRTDYIHDDFEYADPSATISWEGEGDEVLSLDSAIRKFGNYSLKVETDSGTAGEIGRAPKISDLTPFLYLDFWIRSSTGSETIKFYIVDSSSNASYWEITISAADTWQNVTLDLSSPDGNEGTDADLSDVIGIYFVDLSVSTIYHFDQIRFICGNSLVIEGTENSDDSPGHYRRNIWMNLSQPFLGTTQVVSDFNIPESSIRKDLVVLRYYDPAYVTVILEGDAYDYPAPEIGDIPICYVYLQAGQDRIVDFISKDDYATDGYIAADVRPFIKIDSSRNNIISRGDYPSEIVIDSNEISGANWIDFFIQKSDGTSRRQMAQIDYTGLQLYAAGVLAGARINEFSIDGTFSDNSDQAVPTEKATKSYVDSKLIKHFLSGGLVTVSGDDLVVDPAFLWLNSKTLTEVAQITKDATVSGNYIGTDISDAAGFVYVYAKDDGAGGYEVWLSGDEPNRSDCNDSATTGKMIYRKFDTSWYRVFGARYKLASSLVQCNCFNNGYVRFNTMFVIESGAKNVTSNCYVPKTSQLGEFYLYVHTSESAQKYARIRKAGSDDDFIGALSGYSTDHANLISDSVIALCPTNDSGQVEYNCDYTYGFCKQIGFWEVR